MRAAVLAGALLLSGAVWPNRAQTPQTAALRSSDVTGHLEKVIGWYHHVNAEEGSTAAPADIILRDTTEQNALRALQLAFDFARAEAAFRASLKQQAQGGASDANAASGSARNLDDTLARCTARVTGLSTQIDALNANLAKSPGRNRDLLEAQRQQLQSELVLAQEIQKTVQSMVAFAGATNGSASSAAAGLLGQINDLERSVPEARHTPAPKANSNNAANSNAAAAAPAKTATPQPAAAHPENEGLIGLTADLFSSGRDRIAIDDLLGETDALTKNIESLKQPIVAQLRSSIKQSEDITAAVAQENAQQLGAGQKQITALTAQFRQLSTVIVPLGEEELLVEGARGNLLEWRNEMTLQYHAAARYLLLRAGGMLLAMMIVLFISEVWRRATFRYVRDVRRRRQFLLIRRIVVTCAITLLFILGVVTQFGSIATYAGFLTAGLAVALQNVILAVIAYFFLIGRYGVRVGDRVTISGVTGDVLQLGLVRIYLMELIGPPGDLNPTGRVVVYSNSVLFQPQALFKQLPGTNYVWHSITINLAPDSDVKTAEARLGKAVNEAYEKYRPDIEEQHANMARSVEIEVQNPKPDCRIQFTGAALQFRVRFPVDLKKGSDADAEIMRSLSRAIEQEPALRVNSDGAPKLETPV